MDRGIARAGAQRWLDIAAAAVPAGASGFSAMLLAPLAGLPPMPLAALASLAVFGLAYAAMRRTDPPATYRLPEFPAPVAQSELLLERLWDGAGELLLDTPAPLPEQSDELLLDDRLALPDESRVVRLFDPRRFPDPGELNERIARHLARGGPLAASADASDELRQALAELRSALRPASQ